MFHRQDEAPREKEIPAAQQQVPHSKLHAEIRYEIDAMGCIPCFVSNISQESN